MKKLSFVFCLLLLFGCSQREEIADDQEPILVQIGDRSITVSDYVKRSELTIRPFYCRGNTEKDKRIILNSLIAEKLFALETEPSSEIFNNPFFLAYVKGRKEQMMRDKLFEIEAKARVNLSETEIDSAMIKAGMEYKVEFANLSPEQAMTIREKIAENPESINGLFEESDSIFTHTSRYLDNDLAPLQQVLFKRPLQPGHVIEPLQIDQDRFLFIRIKNYTYKPIISSSERIKKKQLVKEQLELNKAQQFWDGYVNDVMRGKKIEFDRESFEYLLELLAERIWNTEQEIDIAKRVNEIILNEFTDEANSLNRPFFKLNDEVWTIGDFRELVLSHPIVFRDDYIGTPRQYVKAFRTAVIDVIQDHFVTEQAYKRKIDRLESIERKTKMWQDAFVALYFQEKYIESLRQKSDFDPEKLSGNRDTYMDVLVDSLVKKYKSKIKLNRVEFEKIKLDNTSFFGFRPGVPYPSLVPAFPATSLSDKIENFQVGIH